MLFVAPGKLKGPTEHRSKGVLECRGVVDSLLAEIVHHSTLGDDIST